MNRGESLPPAPFPASLHLLVAVICAVLVAGALGGPTVWAQESSAPLPVTHAKTLSGASIALPVPGHSQTFLVIGFTKASSAAVKAWWMQSEGACKTHPAVACYEGAMLEDAPGFVHGMIVSGMKHDMPPAQQETFLTIFENEAAWKKTFGFTPSDDAYLAIFDNTGKVVWRTSGDAKAANSAKIAQGFDSIAK